MSKINSVRLRKLESGDKNIIFDWISDRDLRKMTGTRGTPTPAQHDIWFRRKCEDGTNEILIIENNLHPVGIIGTNEIDLFNRNAEMYLYIGEKTEKGKGIATNAVEQFVQYVAEKYALHKITARIFSYNEPSIGLFEKCGFYLEGVQKEQLFCIEENTFADLLWYGRCIEKG